MAAITTISKVHRHFHCVPLDQLVSYRDLLLHGKRSAIDNAVHKPILGKVIFRVAQGVFLRAGGRWPTADELATFKATAFGRELRKHGSDTAVFYRQNIFHRSMPWIGNRSELNTVLHGRRWMPAWLGDCFQTSAYIGPPPIRQVRKISSQAGPENHAPGQIPACAHKKH